MSPFIISSLTLRVGERTLVSGLTLDGGEGRWGLMGANGSGKSTLLATLAGERAPASGHCTIPAGTLYVPQIEAPTSWPGALGQSLWSQVANWFALEKGEASPEQIADLDSAWSWISTWPSVANRWQIEERPWEKSPDTLSGGQLQKLRLALLDLLPKHLVLLDEPTLHLDREARKNLQQLLKTSDVTWLIASHDRDLMEGMDQILYLEDGLHTVHKGGYSLVKAERDAVALRFEKELEHMEDEKRRLKRAQQAQKEKQDKRNQNGSRQAEKGGMPRILLGLRRSQAEATTGRLEALASTRLSEIDEKLQAQKGKRREKVELNFDLDGAAGRGSSWILEVKDFNPQIGGEPLWSRPLSFALERGACLGLLGPNGAGKSTLLRALVNTHASEQGITLRARNWIYLDQMLSHLPDEGRLDQVWQADGYVRDEGLRRTIAARLGLGADRWDRRFGDMSGGERMRAALILMANRLTPPDLVILDEPSNHLDLDTQEAVFETLEQLGATLIIASHEEALWERIEPDQWLDLTSLMR